MAPEMVIMIICLGLITSVLLVCLQPHVNPDVLKSQEHIRGEAVSEFGHLWENFCYPKDKKDIFILVFGILFLLATWGFLFIFFNSQRLIAVGFGISFLLVHVVWYLIYKDGFIPLNALVSAAIFMSIIYHSRPVAIDCGAITQELKMLMIQESISNTRQIVNLMLTIAIAIGASVMAFSFTYMSKMFGSAGEGRYERALFLAQRSVATIAIWNLILFLFFLLPVMYGKINRFLALAMVR